MIRAHYGDINLTTGQINTYSIDQKIVDFYLGGKGLAARILYDELRPGVDPLSLDNILIINTGPLTGTGAPSSSRFNITTKNVMTGGIASSNCGGIFGVRMRKAGYDGLIIRGRSSEPCYIEILDGNIAIKSGSHLWGLNTEECQQVFDRRYGTLVIGPAGENLVNYACAVSGERVAGRCGVGAVMGSKNLKALVAYGTKEIPVHNRAKFSKYVRSWIEMLRNNPATGEKMPRYGTAGFVRSCQESGILPTRNFQRGTYDQADEISGEALAEKYLTRNSGCVSCPIRCERRVMLDGKEIKGPEYETIGLLGANIENCDLGMINRWNYEADLLGVDTISMGGTLAYAMELQERGIKNFGLKFGDVTNISDAIRKIAYREGDFSDLADGSKVMTKKYGGEDFAIHAKGLELAAYDPRRSVGHGLGYATSNRGGCHLNGGYLVFIEAIGPLKVDSLTSKGKAALTVLFQNGMEAVSTAGFCLFTAFTLVPAPLYRVKPNGIAIKTIGGILIEVRAVLNQLGKLLPGAIPFNTRFLFPHAEAIKLATGLTMTTGRFLQMGERVFNMERMFNMREGLTFEDDILPKRLLKELSDPGNPATIVPLDKMLPEYYRVRGWKADGQPASSKLKQLSINLESKDNSLK
ncbi:MAG: aldehyde ferredoxin oxidoreductase family protein [Chitinophagales bacterium]